MTETAYSTVLRVLRAAGHDGVHPKELPALAGRDARQCRRAVAQLIESGLATRDSAHGQIRAAGESPAAEAAVSLQPAPGPEPGRDTGARLADVEPALALLPAEPLRAMARLLLSVIAARRHLRDVRPSGWLATIARGPTQTFKSFLAVIACEVFGLDTAQLVRLASSESERSLWGRRVQAPGGAWTLQAADVLAAPMVCIDEIDKAPSGLARALLKLLQGEGRLPGEGAQVLDIAPAVHLTANPSPRGIPPEYTRRAAVLDTAPIEHLIGDIDATARAVLRALPRLSLPALRPPASELAEDLLAELRAGLQACLTADGWRQCWVTGLELATLGRAGLAGDGDLDAAMHATLLDYLECAITTGEADPGQVARLRAFLAGQPIPQTPAPQTAPPAPARDQADDVDAQAQAYRTANAVSLQIGAQRGDLARLLTDVDDAIRAYAEAGGTVPAQWLSARDGLRRSVRQIRGDLDKAPATLPGLARLSLAAGDVTKIGGELIAEARARTTVILAARADAQIAAQMEAERVRRLAVQAAAPPRRALPAPPALTRRQRDEQVIAQLRARREGTRTRGRRETHDSSPGAPVRPLVRSAPQPVAAIEPTRVITREEQLAERALRIASRGY